MDAAPASVRDPYLYAGGTATRLAGPWRHPQAGEWHGMTQTNATDSAARRG